MTATRVLIAEGAFIFAWAVASIGVKMFPKEHPLRRYHAYSSERVRSIYIKAARAER